MNILGESVRNTGVLHGWLGRVLFGIAILATGMLAVNVGVSKAVKNKILPDESNYCFYAGLFKSYINGNFDNIFWQSELQYRAVPVGVYWIALTIYFSEYNYMLQEPKLILKSLPDLAQQASLLNQFVVEHPFPYLQDMIKILRQRMLVYRALTCILIFMLAWYLGGYVCATFAIFLLLNNLMFLTISSQVLLEIIWLFQHFFNILLIYIFFKRLVVNKSDLRSSVFLLILLGLSVGLLAATKIHGWLNLIIFIICFYVLYLRFLREKTWDRGYFKSMFNHVLVVGAVALLIFILVNPALYHSPFYGLKQIIIARFNEMDLQIMQNVVPADHLTTLWQTLLYLHNKLRFSLADIIMMFVGVVFLIFRSLKVRAVDCKMSVGDVVLISFFIMLLAILVFMRLGQNRYILVLVCYCYIFEALGLWESLKLLWGYLSERLNFLRK